MPENRCISKSVVFRSYFRSAARPVLGSEIIRHNFRETICGGFSFFQAECDSAPARRNAGAVTRAVRGRKSFPAPPPPPLLEPPFSGYHGNTHRRAGRRDGVRFWPFSAG